MDSDRKKIDLCAWIDSHSHVFDDNCSYLGGARYLPRRFVPSSHYLAELDRCGIGAAVLVQPSFLGTDNSYLCRTIAQRPACLRGVAVVADDVDAETLDELWGQGVRGVRLNLIGQADPDFTSSRWRRWVQHVQAAGMSVNLHASGDRWCHLLPPLLDQGLEVVIEHLGRPDGDDPLASAGFRAILAAGTSGRAWAKLSAPYRMAAGVAERAVPALLDAFGPERLVWGSDFPWTQHEDGKTMPGAMAWLSGLGFDASLHAAVAGRNALRLYGFSV